MDDKDQHQVSLSFHFYERIEAITGVWVMWTTRNTKTIGEFESEVFSQLQHEVARKEAKAYDPIDRQLGMFNSKLRWYISEPLCSADLDIPIEELLRSKSHVWHQAYRQLRKQFSQLPEPKLRPRVQVILLASFLLGILPVMYAADAVMDEHPVISAWLYIATLATLIIASSFVMARHLAIPKASEEITLRKIIDSVSTDVLDLQKSISFLDVRRMIREEYRLFMSTELIVPVDEIEVETDTRILHWGQNDEAKDAK